MLNSWRGEATKVVDERVINGTVLLLEEIFNKTLKVLGVLFYFLPSVA